MMRNVRSALWRGEKGQTLPIVALFLLVLVGFLSLVVDGGMAYSNRRYMQNAADAASLAGVVLMTQGITSDSQINSTAVYYGRANRATTVAVDYIDVSGVFLAHAGAGSFPGGANGLQVTASSVYTPGFAAVLGIGNFTVSASASANVKTTGAGNAMILALSTIACPGLKQSGSGSVNVNGGNIQVNSTCAQALYQTGSGSMNVIGGAINVTGGYSKTGSGSITPTPHTGMPYVSDPLLKVPVPSTSGLTVRGAGTAADPQTLLIGGSSSHTLDPGIYYGGISLTGSGSLTLRPGMYYIAGGQLSLTGSGSIIGDGVFFYLTNDPQKPTGYGAYATLDYSGSGSSRIRPMSSGTYKNMTFFMDRASTAGSAITGSGSNLSGTVYLKGSSLTMTGSGSWNGAVQLIADNITLTGSGSLNYVNDPTQLFGIPKSVITQ